MSNSWRVHALVLLVLNLFDALATIYAIDTGRARELNPIMGYALSNAGALGLIWIKLLAYAVVVVMWARLWGRKNVRLSAIGVNALYLLLALRHVQIIAAL